MGESLAQRVQRVQRLADDLEWLSTQVGTSKPEDYPWTARSARVEVELWKAAGR